MRKWIDKLLGWHRDLPEEGPPKPPPKWIGVVTAHWVDSNSKIESTCKYHLYIDGPTRTVKLYGSDPGQHPCYANYLLPWRDGAPDVVIEGLLTEWDVDYWSYCKTRKNQDGAIRKPNPDFKLLKFENNKEED